MNQEQEKLLHSMKLLEAQRHILGNEIVDEAIAKLQKHLTELSPNAELLHQSNEIFLDGERKLVTIMFADFSNFTSMSERMDAEDVRTVMNNCFSKLVPVIEYFGGTIDKFIGDEIMALFGAPHAHDNDAESALRAALEMMDALQSFNDQNRTNLGLHFGINTGVVVTGGMGSKERQQYSVIGDAVNLAARLEDASVTGEILVGEETYKLTSRIFDFEKRPSIKVKGKENYVSLYKLLGLKEKQHNIRGVSGLHSELIGRDEPLQKLIKSAEDLRINQGSVSAIIAEPGMGKSRILSEFKKTNSDIHWVEVRCQSFGQKVSYGLAKTMLDIALNVLPNLPVQEVGKLLREKINSIDPAHFDDIYPYLALMRGIKLEADTEAFIKSVTVEVMQQRIRQAFADFLILMSLDQPVIYVWEDIHWADDSSLQLIEFLFKIVQERAVLFILTFRPHEGQVQEYQLRWLKSLHNYQVIYLEPLTEGDSNQLLENLLQIKDLPEKTRKIIFQKAEGNPFYLEELLRSLMEADILYWHEGKIKLKHDINQLQIPNTLQGIIESRIDRLQPEEKITIQTAAVIGRIFGTQILEYLIENGNQEFILNPVLSSLQERELIYSQLVTEFVFKHAVTQDVAYNSLLLARRRVLHQFAAEAIEVLYGDQANEMSTLLALHYQLAQNHKKAAYYLLQEADKSKQTYSYIESIYLYNEALKEYELSPDTTRAQKVKIYEHLGDVLVILARFAEAEHQYLEAIKMIPIDERIVKARIYRKVGESYMMQRQPENELQQYQLAIEALGAEENQDLQSWKHEWLDIQLAICWSYYWLNKAPEIKQTLELIEATCVQYGTISHKCILQMRWCLSTLRAERFSRSNAQLHYAETAFNLAQRSGDLKLIAYSTCGIGMAFLFNDKLIEAKDHLHEAILICQKIGEVNYEIIALQFILFTYQRLKNVDAVSKFAQQMEAKAAGKLVFYQGSVKGSKAWLAFQKGDLHEAEQQALEGLIIHGNAPVSNAHIKWPLIAVYASQKRYEEALHQLKDLLLPYQYKLPEEVEVHINKAVSIPVYAQNEEARDTIQKIIELARQHKYL